jgi:hypothetical protein
LSAGCAEGCEIRGDSKIHRRQSPKMQARGDSQPHRKARLHSGVAGQPEAHAADVPKNARFEATRSSIAGTALEMQNPGQPGDLAQG